MWPRCHSMGLGWWLVVVGDWATFKELGGWESPYSKMPTALGGGGEEKKKKKK